MQKPSRLSCRAKIENGRISGKELRPFWELVASMGDGPLEITAAKVSRVRSNPQNRYYWGVCIAWVAKGLYEATGERYSPEEIHEYLKQKFLTGRQIADIETGEMLTLSLSTASLSKDDFGEYVDKVILFAAEVLNVVIPEP